MSQVNIAEKLNVSVDTIKKWKKQGFPRTSPSVAPSTLAKVILFPPKEILETYGSEENVIASFLSFIKTQHPLFLTYPDYMTENEFLAFWGHFFRLQLPSQGGIKLPLPIYDGIKEAELTPHLIRTKNGTSAHVGTSTDTTNPAPAITFRQLSHREDILGVHPLDEQQLKDIASLIYLTDAYIYPAMFTPEQAEHLIPLLFEANSDEMFKLDNIFAAFAGNRIVGIILWHHGPLHWCSSGLLALADDYGIALLPSLKQTEEEYFIEYQKTPANATAIINVCVNPGYRRSDLRTGSNMMAAFLEEHAEELRLFVLTETIPAHRLYLRHGFQRAERVNGFSPDHHALPCLFMIREAVPLAEMPGNTKCFLNRQSPLSHRNNGKYSVFTFDGLKEALDIKSDYQCRDLIFDQLDISNHQSKYSENWRSVIQNHWSYCFFVMDKKSIVGVLAVLPIRSNIEEALIDGVFSFGALDTYRDIYDRSFLSPGNYAAFIACKCTSRASEILNTTLSELVDCIKGALLGNADLGCYYRKIYTLASEPMAGQLQNLGFTPLIENRYRDTVYTLDTSSALPDSYLEAFRKRMSEILPR